MSDAVSLDFSDGNDIVGGLGLHEDLEPATQRGGDLVVGATRQVRLVSTNVCFKKLPKIYVLYISIQD